eukprot:3328171-Pleurochrysis_carterae.AAC.1
MKIKCSQIGYGSEFETFHCVFTALNMQAGGDRGHVQFRGQSRPNYKLWICGATYERNPAANASWELNEEDELVPKTESSLAADKTYALNVVFAQPFKKNERNFLIAAVVPTRQ